MLAHPVMLAGLGGAVVPLVIHLLNRARRKSTRWGAMMFLPSTGGGGDASSRIESWLLLPLRMLLIALLSVTLARPILGKVADDDTARMCVIFLFDNSAGMQFNEGTAGTRIESARTVALSIANRLQRNDQAHFIPLASAPEPPSSATEPPDLQGVIAQIVDVQPADGAADIASGLTAAARLLSSSDAEQKVIVLIASRQAANWRNVTDVFATTFREKTLAMSGSMRIMYVPIGSESSSNVAIDAINLPAAPLVRGMPQPCNFVLHNYGSIEIKALPLNIHINGQRPDIRMNVDLPPATVTPVETWLTFASTGRHLVQARILDSSRVPGSVIFDDQCQAVADVTEPIDVEMISDARATTSASTTATTSSSSLPQSAIVAAALAPFRVSDKLGANLAKVIDADSQTDWAEKLDPSRVLVLASEKSLDAQQLQKVKSFVSDGGGLLLLSTSGGIPGIANSFFTDRGAGASTLVASAPVQRTIQLTPAGKKFLFPMGDPQGLSEVTIDRLWRLGRRVTGDDALVQSSDRRAVVVSRSFSLGRVILIATELDSESNLARSPVIVPLLQSMVKYLSASTADRLNLTPGEPFDFFTRHTGSDRATITLPDNSRQSVAFSQIGNRETIHFTNTARPGRYEVNIRGKWGMAQTEFIVRAPRDGSDLTPLSPQRSLRVEQLLPLNRVEAQSADSVVASFYRSEPHDLWLYGLLLIAGGMLLELWWSNRMTERS